MPDRPAREELDSAGPPETEPEGSEPDYERPRPEPERPGAEFEGSKAEPEKPEGPELRRSLGLLDATGIGFGAIVGAGIFVVTGVAAGVAATANALSSAQLAAEYPQSGGTYEYGYRVLHPWAGYVAGWMFLASKIAAAGTVAIGLAGYVDALLPGVHPRLLSVGAIVAFTALNYFGIRRSSRANLVIVAVALGSLPRAPSHHPPGDRARRGGRTCRAGSRTSIPSTAHPPGRSW